MSRLALTAPQIGWLRQLAGLVRAAPTSRDRAAAIMIVVRAARDRHAHGASWAEIATALGVTEDTLRRWRTTDAKPMAPPRPATTGPSPTQLPGPPPAPPGNTDSGFGTISARVSHSQSQHMTSTASASTSAPASTDVGGALTPSFATRRVLVVSGDPRPGNNFFGPEAATIRKVLSPAYVDVRELSCVELGELAHRLDTLRPGVLHVAAHSSFGGIVFSLDGSPLSVGYDAFTETIERSFRPRLVVMNFCNSHALSGKLAGLVHSLITWPDAVDDDQCATFAGQLYRALAHRKTAGRAYDDCGALRERWPGLASPLFTGDYEVTIF